MSSLPRAILVLLLLASLLLAVRSLPAQDVTAEVKELTRKLDGGGTLAERVDAAELLGYIGDASAVPALVRYVRVEPATFAQEARVVAPELRAAALEALGRIGGKAALAALADAIRDQKTLGTWDFQSKRQLGEALARIGDPGTRSLVQSLAENRYTEAVGGTAFLYGSARFGDAKAVEQLVNLTRTANDARTMTLILSRLGEVGNDASDKELSNTLDRSPGAPWASAAARSLGLRHAKVAGTSLLNSLGRGYDDVIAQSLGMIAERRATGELKRLVREGSDRAKLNAAFALARMGDSSGLDFARKLLETQDVEAEPPKGNFQFLAKCGLCRTPLCPPNYHEFTERLLAHHKERHDRVPLDEFRAKVANTSNPEEMEAWKKAASLVEEWHCAQCDQLVADERELLEHLKTQHGERLEKPEPEVMIPANKVRDLDCRDLRRLCNQVWDKEKKEPGHFLALLRQALNQRGLQIFRDMLGHQYACRYRPRHITPRDQITPRQQEMIALAVAPARRGHKPNRHTLRDHFATQGVSEQEVYADVDALVKQGLLAEFDNGQIDALGPGSHIESR